MERKVEGHKPSNAPSTQYKAPGPHTTVTLILELVYKDQTKTIGCLVWKLNLDKD